LFVLPAKPSSRLKKSLKATQSLYIRNPYDRLLVDRSAKVNTLLSEDELKRMGIERERQQKDESSKYAHASPIPYDQLDTFAGLKYFPVDAKYRFKVRLQKHPSPEVTSIMTSTGDQKQFLRYGFFGFLVDGKVQRLEVFKSVHARAAEETLFIPFRDKTSGSETYGAARYIDIPENERGIYELDLNKAYNPYCAYNQNYVCPLAPKENWLDLEIRAGEKVYIQH